MYKKFRGYYVKDKHGNVEMEISCPDGNTFEVHYPQYETFPGNRFMRVGSYTKFNIRQLGMLLWAYGIEQWLDFDKYIEKMIL